MKNLLKFTTFLCLISSLAFGQTAQDVVRPFLGIPSVGSRASGLAQAYTAVANDITAIHYNPAGLAHVTWAELSYSGSYISLNNRYNAFGNESSIRRNFMNTNTIGYAWPAYGSKITIGIGYFANSILKRAFSINDSYERENGDNVVDNRTIEEDGVLGSYSAGLGYQVNKDFSIGFSLHLYQGNNLYDSNLYRNINDKLTEYNDIYQIDTDYSGFGASFGFLWSPNAFSRTGFKVTTPVTFRAQEDFYLKKEFYFNDINYDSTYSEQTEFAYKIKAPMSINLGQAFNLGPILITGNIMWSDWSLYRFESDLKDLSQEINRNIKNNFKFGLESLEYAAGGELLLPFLNIKVRGGLHYIPSYLQDDSIEDKLVTSLGTSILLAQSFKIDIAYNQTSWDEQFQENESATLDNIWTTVNFSYRF